MLSACATLQPPEIYNYEKGSTIGIVNILPKTLKHYHIGTTIFNNSEKEFPVSWDLPGDLSKELQLQCNALGYKTVLINSSVPLFDSNRSLTTVNGNKLVIDPAAVPALQELVKQHGIDLLLVLRPAVGTVFVPNIDVKVSGYGVVTRNFLFIGQAKVFSKIDVTAISAKPLAVTQGAQLNKLQSISGLKMIGNFSELTDDDLPIIKESLYAQLAGFISDLLVKSSLAKR
jgi:hypothetical protein